MIRSYIWKTNATLPKSGRVCLYESVSSRKSTFFFTIQKYKYTNQVEYIVRSNGNELNYRQLIWCLNKYKFREYICIAAVQDVLIFVTSHFTLLLLSRAQFTFFFAEFFLKLLSRIFICFLVCSSNIYSRFELNISKIYTNGITFCTRLFHQIPSPVSFIFRLPMADLFSFVLNILSGIVIFIMSIEPMAYFSLCRSLN